VRATLDYQEEDSELSFHLPLGLPDFMIAKIAEKENCVIVTLDGDFYGYENALVIPRWWVERYNSWDIVTKVIKEVFKRKEYELCFYCIAS
jgi:predicted nuclease of predicted toxin-antitoxin system